jgi:hypothetical protein
MQTRLESGHQLVRCYSIVNPYLCAHKQGVEPFQRRTKSATHKKIAYDVQIHQYVDYMATA